MRGFRVEPGEIEAALVGHPGVREAAVVAPADANGDRRMAAFVVTDAGIGNSELRAHLAERLPAYMVPATFVFAERLPVTPNGKLDRTALMEEAVRGAPGTPAAEAKAAPETAASTDTEQVIAGIWAEVLGVEGAGPDDDFFASGGHSLLAMKLISDVNEALGVELTVRSLLVDPKLGALVEEVERAGGNGAAPPAPPAESTTRHPTLVPIRPEGDLPPLFLVAGGMGGEQELLVYARLTRHLDPRQPFYGLRARGVDDLVEPHESVEAMATEYLEEIRRIQPRGPYYISGGCVGGVVAFELAQQLRADGEEIDVLVLIDSNYPTRPRMMRNHLVNLWRDILPPEVGRPPGIGGAITRARARLRVLREPSEEQRTGMRRSAIGNRYLRRILRYRPRPYDGKLTFIACENREVDDAARVWRDLAAGGLDVHYVPGDHYSHLRDHAATTAACLDDCLRNARLQRSAAPGGRSA